MGMLSKKIILLVVVSALLFSTIAVGAVFSSGEMDKRLFK
jgi:hypothetical protein